MNILYTFFWFVINFVTHVFFRIRIVNRDRLPREGAYILASNHISLADPPILGSTLNRPIHFMAKKELFEIPLFGGMLRIINAFPVDRKGVDRSAIKKAVALLNSNRSVVIFPEGTRGKHGKLLKPQPGIGLIARHCHVPIVPTFMTGSNRLGDCFRGRENLSVIYGQPIDSDEVKAYDTGKDGYRRLADEIMSRIQKIKDEYELASQVTHQGAG
jgi:1-acyl-sn-glycerol-3-phosphate acyltransferase